MLRICIFFSTILLATACPNLSFAVSSTAFSLSSDTLIIDSDTIYIEQDQVMLPEDSLPSEAFLPARKSLHPWSLSFLSGANLTHTEVYANNSSLLPLAQFMGNAIKPQLNLALGTDIGFRFLTLPGELGTIELSAMLGYLYNRVKISCTSIQDNAQLAEDSIVFFKEDGGLLNMGYFVVTESPDIGEVDSVDIALAYPKISFTSHDLALKLRATLNKGSRKARVFLETGIIRRFIGASNSNNQFYFLNETGQYNVIPVDQVKPAKLIVPHFGLGIEGKVNPDAAIQDRFLTLGATLNASFPSSTIYSDAYFSMDIRNYSLYVFARYFF